MAQSGYTPISLYFSATGAAVPTAGNLVAGELALNTNDGKLYFKNSAGVVTLLAGSTSGPAGGSTTQVQYNNAGVLAGITGATTNGTALTLVAPNLGSPFSVGTMPAFTLGGTVSGGGNQINNVVIGTSTPLAGAFTSLTASTTLGVTGVSTLTGGAVVQGLTVGLGAGAVSTNTAVGVSALAGNSTGARVTAIGASAGIVNTASDNVFIGCNTGASNTSGARNTALGSQALANNVSGTDNTAVGYTALLISTGSNNTAVGGGPYPYATLSNNNSGAANTAVGTSALAQNTSASNNTAVGYQAGYTNSTGTQNTFLGTGAGYTNDNNYNVFIGQEAGRFSTGSSNLFIGYNSGYNMTTGSSNVIVGGYPGNSPLDIRALSNYLVLADGVGNLLITAANAKTVALQGAVPNTGTGITFPATQSASSDANTLDDYEEGTFTATFTPSTSGTITLSGSYNTLSYTKVGRVVTIAGEILVSSASAPIGTSVTIGGFPFAAGSGNSSSAGFAILDLGTLTLKPGRIGTTSSTADMFITASTIGTNSNFMFGFSYIV
jgi:hypothetical protein